MNEIHKIKVIARIHNDFNEKFGIPRQSGILKNQKALIVFEPEYRVREAFRGLEKYEYLWLIWQFSNAVREEWSPTVRPPRLGGNIRMGVFATRSPFRPNAIGLSSVRLERVELDTKDGPVLYISGADLMNGTPIYDIKPYIPYTDSHPGAAAGFTDALTDRPLQVKFLPELLNRMPENEREALTEVLSADPRPRYQNDPQRVYGMTYANLNIRFKVDGENLTVTEIIDDLQKNN